MKKLIFVILLVLVSSVSFAEYPRIEVENPGFGFPDKAEDEELEAEARSEGVPDDEIKFYVTRMKGLNREYEAGGFPLDIEVVREGDDPMLVILSDTSNGSIVNVVNIGTGEAFTIDVEDSAGQILFRQTGDSGEIVLYGGGSIGVRGL